MPLISKRVAPVETDSDRADKIHNCVVRSLSQILTCIERTNALAAKGDIRASLAALDPAVITILRTFDRLVADHMDEPASSDLI